MENTFSDAASTVSPLESFLREYLDKTGGIWEEVEPQVYDMVLPEGTALPIRAGEGGVVRLTFDPEALPEHPAAQLASFGTPLVDQLLSDAIKRGRGGQFYLIGQNLQPHDLLNRSRRSLHVAPASIQVERVRALSFPQVIFWFQAAFVSDQKEQIILPVAIDLHHGREVRHRDQLLEPARLAEHPSPPLPPARASSLQSGYQLARAQLLRTLASLANNRGRELHERCDIQVSRLERYYADLRTELDEQKRRARNIEEAAARHAERLAALVREEKLRVAELRQKSILHVDLRLLQLLRIEQPKLLVQVLLTAEDSASGRLEVVWDPLLEQVEAVVCPNCGKPSYEFTLIRSGQVGCGSCKATLGGAKAGRKY
ncbi:MAG TPA: hypothetical protein VGP68_00085 [Gemmataceae bacterium]|nr:hypothetical protein [Gemmataceae bacterium]